MSLLHLFIHFTYETRILIRYMYIQNRLTETIETAKSTMYVSLKRNYMSIYLMKVRCLKVGKKRRVNDEFCNKCLSTQSP